VTTTLYEYDDHRYLNTKITQKGAGVADKAVKFTYNTKGENIKIERYLDGLLKVTTDNAYDIYGRLTGIAQVKGITPTNPTGTPISDDVYVLDNLNRLQTQTKGGQVKEIGYDKTDQVQTVTGAAGEAYTYDLNGNRTNGGYTTGVDNRLTSDGTYSYQYDPEGNRQSRTKISDGAVDLYTWDYRNRLTGIVSKDSGGAVIKTVGYTYDVDDQRVSKTVTTGTGSTTEKYYLDGNQIAFVTDGGGNQMFHYLYGLNVDQVMAQDSPAGMVWALADRLGSIDTLTDGEGVVVDKRTFDSFGRVLSESNPSVSFRYGYTGRELDLESGLNYYRARYYDSNVGRFISVDPMGFGAGDTNLYRYVGNNSTNATDPTGLYSFDDFGRDAGNFGQGIGRNFDYSFDAINSNVFAPVGNAVIKPVVNAINTNFITPFNNATSNAVGFYTDLVNEGQREGGIVGTFKQGAGIFGGTFASTPGAVGSFVQNNGTRIGGLLQAIGGAGEIYAGATTSATVFGAPVGALLAANGVDNFQAGLRKLFTGEDANTLLYDATKRLTGSDKLAGTVDAATGLVLNAAAASAAAKQAAAVADARAVDETFSSSTSRLEELRAKYGKFTKDDINDRINLRGATQDHLQGLIDSG
jgi:RHS repeat-associated protein